MRKQSIFWFGIMIVFGLGFCAMPAQAKYGGGSGTATEPYLIDTAEHMNILGGQSRDWGKHFKLIADIDFGGSTGGQFNFIGYFSGVFDGNGHSIHDFEPLDSCASFRVGLFGTISNQGEVRNLTLVNPRVQCLNSSSSFSGGLLVGELNGKVTNCHVIGGYIEKYFPPWPRTTTYGDIGGLVGSVDMDAVVSDCSVKDTNIRGDAAGGISGGTGLGTIQDCTVINVDINGGWYTGGIISRNMGTVERCSATGVIRAEWVAGGIVGVTGGPPNSTFDPVIRECYASCIVSSNDQAGGLAGKAADKCLIIDCYAAGSVEGHSNGGLVCCYGNFRGVAPQVVNCYAAASVSENNKGGLIKHAHLDGGPVIVLNSFWDVEASGVMNSAGGTGRTTAQMKTKDTFTTVGWDFTTPIWKMCDRPDYPRLWWEECPPPLIIYVDADATGANNGSSWDHAYNDLQDALVVAESSDEIRVAQGAYSPEGPLPDIRRASNPNPTDRATSVSRTADLSWTPGAYANSHDLYFGTTSPGIFQDNQTATTFDPGTMDYYTTYYWRIDEVSNEGKTTGAIWSFMTLSPPPPMGSNESLVTTITVLDRTATFQLKNGVVIKGGYAGFGEPDPNARDIEVYETVLSGDLAANDEPNFASNGENSYHVVTGSGCDETAVLNGFTIIGGNDNRMSHYDPIGYGSGMLNESGSPTVSNCNFTGNYASNTGGGMYNWESSPTLTNCTFTGNSAGGWAAAGGAMFNFESSPAVINCTFVGNSSKEIGGAICNYIHSSPTLSNCIFRNNSTTTRGGAICNLEVSSPTLANCSFNGNEANVNGGGMFNSECSPTLVNCTFIRNSASAGGGMYNQESAPTLKNCIFSENSAVGKYGDGAGMHNKESSPRLNNCTFIRNKADRYGGAMNSYRYATPTLTNCILWDDIPEEIYVYGRMPLVTYSNVQGGWPGEGNIDTDPCFIQPEYFGPIAYWKLDESSGTTAYDSVGDNHGTIYGAQWTSGKINGALDFDGVNDFVKIADSDNIDVTGQITIKAWVNVANPAGIHQHYVVDSRDGTGGGYGLNVDTEVIQFWICGNWYRDFPSTIQVGNWHYVVGMYDGSKMIVYIDGVEMGRYSFTGNIVPSSGSLYIGQWYGYSYRFHGMIDEVAIYDSALSAEEIQQHYQNGLSGRGYPYAADPDYHLLPGSPCINAGDPDYIAGPDETDLDGKPRVIAGRIDMGAYEFNHNPIADAGPNRTVEAQAPWGATVTLDGSGSSDDDSTPGTIDDINDFNWYELDPCDPNADVFLASGMIVDCNLSIGEHIVLLEVIDRAGASDTNEVTIIVQDTTPPEFTNIPQNLAVECDGSHNLAQLNAWLASATAFDQCGDVNVTNDFVGLLNGCGATGSATVTWTAEDESGNTTTTPPATFTIVDTTPPAITCPPDVTLQCPADTSVEANGSATAGDTCSSVAIAHSDLWQPGCGNTGTLARTWTATDDCGNSSSCVQTLTVVDTTPPQFEFSVAPTMLWPPDHKMVLITPSWTVSDDCDAAPEVSLVSIIANEGDNTIGDGHTSNDIQINEDGSIYLRSERSGTSDDRVYTITYQAVDDCGNATLRSATVSIPHDFKVLARIASRWLWAGPGRIPEDLNGDGVVNLKDIAIFAKNWIQ